MNRPIRIAHIITSLEPHGAQRVLQQVLTRLPPGRFQNSCISLRAIEEAHAITLPNGVSVTSLNMRPGRPPIQAPRLIRLLRDAQPDIVQTWLYHADLAGLFASYFLPGVQLVWNIRCSNMHPDSGAPTLLPRILRYLSGRPRSVVVNSVDGMNFHQRIGYHPRHWVPIPNGFETDRFLPDEKLRSQGRQRLNLSEQDIAVGVAARFHPMKGHETLIRAVAASKGQFKLVFIGTGPSLEIDRLKSICQRCGLGDQVIWAGHWEDMEVAYNALNLLVSSSLFGEGFPNVVGEAMACGTPCIVTDVGDSAEMIGDPEMVVPPNDPHALANAISKFLSLTSDEQEKRGNAARRRVEKHYTIETMVMRFTSLYEEITMS